MEDCNTNKKILVEAEKIETKNDRSIDYSLEIIDLMGKVRNKDLLKRVYKLLVYLYLRKDDEESITGEPLTTELMCDYRKELQEHIESLDVIERELVEIQKKTFELQRLIHIDKISISDFIGQE